MSLQRLKQCLPPQSTAGYVNAFVHAPQNVPRLIESVTAEAKATGSRARRRPAIAGKYIAVKDNICTQDQPTTCASNVLKDFRSPYNATVVERLLQNGAIIAGKTNMDEFGMGSHSTQSAFGPTFQRSIDNTERSVGGSSGGSALAVAMGQCSAALGTDTGGSVRLPAAYTGIFGFKPSYGLLSRHGVVAYTNSLDTVGIMANNVDIVEDIFELLNQHDPQDPTSVRASTRKRMTRALQKRSKPEKLRVGVPMEYNLTEIDDTVREYWRKTLSALAFEGHSIIPVSLPATKQALSAYYILAPAEASSNLAKYDGARYGNASLTQRDPGNTLFATTRGEGLGEEVRRRIVSGSFTLSSTAIDNYFIKAQRVRRLVQREFDNVFSLPNPLPQSSLETHEMSTKSGVDILLSPTAPTRPPLISDLLGRTAQDSYRDDVFTVPASLAGLPAMSFPVSEFKGAPQECNIGLQIAAQYSDDEMIFHAVKILQKLQIEDR